MTRYLAVVLLLAACGDDNGATPIDAAIDVAIDVPLPVDAPPPPVGHSHYVIDSVQVPTTNLEARNFGQDLDGNTTIDNQLGQVLATFAAQGFEVQAATTESVDRGTSITLLDLFANNFTTEPAATIAAFVGANPMPAACASANDPTCRHHLTGTASFTIPMASATNPPLAGTITAGALTTTAGAMAVPISIVPGAAPILVKLVGAKVVASQISAAKITTMKVGGAVTLAEMDATVYPAMRDGFQVVVAKDCNQLASPPACGCAAGSDGKNWLQLLDSAPADCQITIAEIKASALFQSLFAPDVSINGQMAISFGFQATAVAAAFVTP